MVTEVREKQSSKAEEPIVVTLLGMVTEVRESQSEKAEEPIVVTPSPIITCLTLLSACHGLGLDLCQSCISPVPVMVNTPSSVSFHCRLSPQVPDFSA